ncbi:MAG: hypothetical protein V3R16_02535 [Nitrospirales bacterium]
MSMRLDEARQKAMDSALQMAAAYLRRMDAGYKSDANDEPTTIMAGILINLACLDLADELEERAKAHKENG